MTKVRLTAAERGEEVLRAAVVAFGSSGYEGTKTDEIARLAGVSQPYVIRLFGTKQQLFLAAVRSVCDRIKQVFAEAAAESPELASLARGYTKLSEEREVLLVLLQGFAASSDPTIGAVVREGFGSIYELVREATGASPTEVREFFATGMLLTVMSAMNVTGPDAFPAGWAEEIAGTFTGEI
ncbi:TetR/AcrR family transcriptional regulator [Kribbella sandramycini]|uniref:AcrR family transcriptional regulator n=1 Tax=Kribbella sandramycini TaxID=60450 RepID=A0A7Y4P2G2_9ACTN|nr:TetR/AcrR family transcriptional regulator [Kribbella sandramycini]MBB6567030.1 AcrR family transcriptional regulator [Kribbella sandramycini]NOL44751.1 TetR/AcrR family transcriptional regulator [Kribbella sandramycini]